MRKYNQCWKQLISAFAAAVLFLIFCTNVPDVLPHSKPAGPSRQISICSYTNVRIEAVRDTEIITARVRPAFVNQPIRSTISLKCLKIILMMYIFAGRQMQVHIRLLCVSEKAATRSQIFTIRYIHNMDGQKA